MKSIWQENVKLPTFAPLDSDVHTDILIIGGGLAGLLCAYSLHRAGAAYLLVEADSICAGVTAGTTAKVTALHGLCYDRLIGRLGKKAAQGYFQVNSRAIESLRQIAADVNCEWQDCRGYLYTAGETGPLRRELSVLEKIGGSAAWIQPGELPYDAAGAVVMEGQAVFHPLQFAAGIAPGLNIRTHTRITSFDGQDWHTANHTIRANRTIVATHFPIWNKHGLYPVKLYQERSYVLSLSGAEPVEDMYLGAGKTDVTIRSSGDSLILSGNSHRTGKPGTGWKELEAFAARYYPHAAVSGRWAAQDCMTLDGMPYIGRYSVATPDLYVATGFGKWGMTLSMAAAEILTDELQGRQNSASSLFDPSRDMIWGRLASNIAHSAAGVLTFRRPRCPHLGCALRWNPQEHSWDCPCHGSRFSEDGHLLDGPATGDMG